MSRIHEALRRAAEERSDSSADAQDASTPSPVDGDAVTALAREPFPVEIGAQTRTAAHAPVDATAFKATEARVDERRPEPPPAEPGEKPAGTIFERIDARLAEKVVADERISP